jgi:hypothetical protein
MIFESVGGDSLVGISPDREVFGGACLLIEVTGSLLVEAGSVRPPDYAAEFVDLAVDMAIRLQDLQECLTLSDDLL